MNGRDTHGMLAAALLGREAAVRPGAGRDLAHRDGHPDGLGRTPDERRRQPGRPARRLRRWRRLPPERQRARPRDARGRDGAPGAVPAADHPGVRATRSTSSGSPASSSSTSSPHVPRERRSGPCARRAAGRGAGEPRGHGRVHSWDLSTGVDGPGTRLVVFLAGCPLRCLYCQNPDTWHMRDGRRPRRAPTSSGACAATPASSTTAGGGVTVSGGEPLLQPAFTRDVFDGGQASSACTPRSTPPGSWEPGPTTRCWTTPTWSCSTSSRASQDTCRRLTGGALAPTLAFADRLADAGNAGVGALRARARLDRRAGGDRGGRRPVRAALANVERVDVLPYHKLGRSKYERLGLQPPLADTPAPTRDQVAAARAVFAARGLVVS